MIRTCLLFCLIFGSGCLLAQDVVHQQLIDNSAIEYLRIVGNQSVLYYGNEQDVQPRATNQPYLKNNQYVEARLSYRKVIYPKALLRLDLSRDELITLSPGFRHVVLFPENVDFVELHGKHVIYFRRDSLPGCPSGGYYFLLHSEECKVLERQTASLILNSSTGEFYYALSTKFYLCKDGVYYNIRNQKGLLKVLSPYKKELKRYISSHHWRFRRDTEELIAMTVREYENLTGMQ